MDGANVFDEQVAAHYEAWYETQEGQRADALEKASLEKLLKRFPDAHRVLEVGCGTGHFTRWLRGIGLKPVGLDLSRAMLAEAKGPDQLTLVQADAHRLPFGDGAFDVTAFITTLEFLENPAAALEEALRVASQGILLGVLNRFSALALQRRMKGWFRPGVYDHARFYTVGELRELLHRAASSILSRTESKRGEIAWHTTLFPRWMPWKRGDLPLGGFIAMALLSPDVT